MRAVRNVVAHADFGANLPMIRETIVRRLPELKAALQAIRVRGDHHIFTRTGVDEIMKLQPIGAKAKPYPVRQVRNAVLKYRLEL